MFLVGQACDNAALGAAKATSAHSAAHVRPRIGCNTSNEIFIGPPSYFLCLPKSATAI
jgi:hypothetical protein